MYGWRWVGRVSLCFICRFLGKGSRGKLICKAEQVIIVGINGSIFDKLFLVSIPEFILISSYDLYSYPWTQAHSNPTTHLAPHTPPSSVPTQKP